MAAKVSVKKLTKQEQRQMIYRDYMREHGTTDVDPDELTAWALNTGRVPKEPTNHFLQTKRQLVKAMRADQCTDPQGREFGKMIAIRIKGEKRQRSIWFELLEAKPKRALVALSQQRRSLVSYARKLKMKRESYNDNNKYGAELPLFDFNLNKDLREAELPTVYPDDAPEGDD